MPKSRHRKKRTASLPAGVVKMTPEMHAMLLARREAFRKKFGRDPGPGDPVFFDPDADQPTKFSAVRIRAKMLEAMRKAGTPPHIIYAYEKTDLLLTKDSPASPSDRKAWNDAIDDYFAIEAAKKNNPDRPDPKDWKTEIPELLTSPFSRQDLAKVVACVRAIGPFEKGLSVVARIELAAAFMATACEHAFDTAKDIKGVTDGADRSAIAEDLVVRRAWEIYAQGSAGSK